MSVVRLIRFVACLAGFALAIAGCAGTGTGVGTSEPAGQSLAGDGTPQAMTVLVNDFEFSPDVDVVDHEVSAKLSSKLGAAVSPNAIKGITVRRVADEIVAIVVAVLREETSLNVNAGNDEDIPPKGATLVITGQLRAAEKGGHSEQNPVRFGAGTVADVALQQVVAGAKKQLLNFTAQSGHGSGGGINKRTLDAQIAAVLGAKSSPDVKLSPDVERQARDIGRAIAERIAAYTLQQGLARRVSAPPPIATERPAETQPVERIPREKSTMERRRGEQRPANAPAAARRDTSPPPPKPFPCQAFTRNERGNLYVAGPITVDIGTEKNKRLQNLEIPPKFFTIGGVDLYAFVQKQCGGRSH
jgi:hypothetical protein